MIHVLHILWAAHIGGIERLVLDLATAQSKNPKIHVDIFFGKRVGDFLLKFQESGFKCHSAYLKSGFDLSPWKYFGTLRVFQNYDILHFHNFNPLLFVSAELSGKRIVYTEHGNFGFGRRKTWRDSTKNFFLKRFLNYCVDYISFNSQFTKQIAENRYGLKSVPRAVIYNGIAFKNVAQSMNITEDHIIEKIRNKFIIGTIARFVGYKRIDRLIEAFTDFQEDKNTILLLVGDGILRGELERLTKELKISDKTIFTGFRLNVQEFVKLMDVCVFPSENEPFGLVAIEALSLGKPAIVFKDGGGFVEVVSGFSQENVVEDISDLVQRLEYYYKNRDEIIEYSQNRIFYAMKFDISNMADQFSNIYETLVGGDKN